MQNEEAVRGKVVMDMGCGTAVLAILAAKMKAARVYNALGEVEKAQVALKKIVENYASSAQALEAQKMIR